MYQILAGKREPTVEGVLGNEKAAYPINDNPLPSH